MGSFTLALMRITWLLPHEESGLTPIARKNIATASLMLCGLWLLDVLAWSGLWNMLLNGSLTASGPLTPVAVLLGVIFATLILRYESTFFSCDFRKSLHPRTSLGIRVSVILLIAFVTAVPIDLYLLEPQIDQRLHYEHVLLQFPSLIWQWDDAKARMAGNRVTDAELKANTVEHRSAVEIARQNRDEQARRWSQAHHQAEQQAQAVRELERSIAAPDLSDAEMVRREEKLAASRHELAVAQQEENRQAASLGAADERSRRANLNLETAVSTIRLDQMTRANLDANRYANWIHDLANSPPRQDVHEHRPPADSAAFSYDASQETAAKLGERLIALGDILAGRTPRRPKMNDADRATLADMKLSEFVIADPEAAARGAEDAAALRRLTWACFAAFIFLPAMLLALKGLFDQETLDYFDTAYQRQLGYKGLPEPRGQERAYDFGHPGVIPASGPAGSVDGHQIWYPPPADQPQYPRI